MCVDFVHTLAGYEDSTANCCNLDTAVERQCRSTADLCSASSQSLQCAVYASRTRKETCSGRGEHCQRNVNTPDDRTWNAGVAYEQLMAAGGPQMLATSNVRGVDAAVRRVLWCGVTCHPADAGDEQCLRCGCSSPSCTVMFALLGRASRPIKHQVTYSLLT